MAEYENCSLEVRPDKVRAEIYIGIVADNHTLAWMTFVSAEQADTAIQLLTKAKAAVWGAQDV